MRRVEPYITIRAVRPLVSGLQALGHDPTPLLASAGLHAGMVNDPDGRVPWEAVLSLIAHAVDRTGDSNLGLHLAEHADLGSFDVHIHAVLSSPTLRDTYERLCRYQRLIHETTRVELTVHGAQATGVEIDPELVRAAERAAHGVVGVTFRQADATRLPFPDSSFDVAATRDDPSHPRLESGPG